MSNVYPWPHARRKDPQTSKDAAASIDISAQAWRVLQAYNTGRELLDHDAYRMVGLGEKRYAHQRCSDLRDAGLIERTGNRGVTPAGSKGYFCRITEAGKNFIRSGGTSTLPPTPTTGKKMKVDFNTRVAQYVKLRDLIKVKETEHKEALSKYKKALEDLNSILLNHLNDVGANSVNTAEGTVYRTEKKSASLTDAAAFMEYVIANEAWDLMDRKANVTAVAEFIKQNNELPPGCNYSSTYVAGVRRPEQEKKND